MNDSVEALQGEVLDRIQQSDSEKELEQIRVEILGRSGSVTLLLRGLKDLPAEERPRAGERLNQLRRTLEGRLQERLDAVKQQAKAQALKEDRIDITFPGSRWTTGNIHPITLVIEQLYSDRSLTASYFYDKHAKYIELGGEFQQDSLTLHESGEPPARFELEFQADGSLTGTWQQGEKRALAVKLTP